MSGMPRRLVPLVLLLLPLLVAAAPSPVVYPPQELPLSFSHARHLGRAQLACTRCHARALTSRNAADDLLPEEATCTGSGCHTVDRRSATTTKACTLCHSGGWNGQAAPPAVVLPAPNLKFPHALHQQPCSECHGDPRRANTGLMTRADLPRMAQCLGCHDGKSAPARCTTCHVGDAAGRVRTDFPEGQLVPADTHPPDVRVNHARAARSDAASCESCHTRSLCIDCHDGRVKPLDFHAGDYQLTHPVDARRNTPACSSCHRAQTFCTGCHARAGVTTDRRTSEDSSALDAAGGPSAPRRTCRRRPSTRPAGRRSTPRRRGATCARASRATARTSA